MSLKEQLFADLKTAMKEKDTIKKDTIQLIRSGVLQIEKDNKVELDDEGVIEVISKQLKSRRDSLPDYEKSGRQDLIEKLNKEIEVLLSYLPEQLSEEISLMMKLRIQRMKFRRLLKTPSHRPEPLPLRIWAKSWVS